MKTVWTLTVILTLMLLLNSVLTTEPLAAEALTTHRVGLQVTATPDTRIVEPLNILNNTAAPGQPPFGAVSAPSAVQPSTRNWHIECVDCPKQFSAMTDHSLRVDADGHPHVAYGGDHLYYAWHDGIEWRYETVDESPNVGKYTSLALDALGRPHISYLSYTPPFSPSLKYAWHDGSVWHIETVDSEGDVGGSTSLALDSADRPHIGYFDNNGLKYAWRDGTNWRIETVNDSEPTAAYVSLALDEDGRAYIAYYVYGEGWHEDDALKFAWHDGVTWHNEIVEDNIGVSGNASLMLDGTEQPHISYPWGGIKHAWRDGAGWHIETVNSEDTSHVSLALDDGGLPCISYQAYTHTGSVMKYAWYDGQSWHDETVDIDKGVGPYTSLALDGLGQPHIIYSRILYEMHDAIKHAWYDGAIWHIETVDVAGDVGQYNSLALDKSGHAHISYFSDFPDDLRYAWHDGAIWHIETVDNVADVGRPNSLALDSAGRPHIGYRSYDWGTYVDILKYTWHDGSTWWAEGVEEPWFLESVSLALDALDQPHISYGTGVLKYTRRDGSGWHNEVVDTYGYSGSGASLALDKDGHPHISYGGGGVNYVWHNGSTWYTETVDNGMGPSLALDEAGHPYISYSNDDGLKCAWRDGTNWHIETVDGIDNWVVASLALDSAGRPHIGFFDSVAEALKYARFDGLVWRIETVDDTAGVSLYVALALDEADQPHISYYDTVNGDLKYARLVFPPLFLDKQAMPSDGLRNNDTLTYTLTISGPGLSVRLWDPLPPSVRYVADSITGTVTPTAVYSLTAHAVVWQGTLPTDTVQTVRFQVTPGITGTGSLSLSLPIVNTTWLTDTENGRSVSATAIVNGWRVYLPLVLK